jgi:hypothetical protein
MPGFSPVSDTPVSALPGGAGGSSLVFSGSAVEPVVSYTHLAAGRLGRTSGVADTPCFEGGAGGRIVLMGSPLLGAETVYLDAGGRLLVTGSLPGWPEGVVALSGVAGLQVGYRVFATGRLTLSGVASTRYSPAYRPTGKLTLSGTPGLRATYKYLAQGLLRFTGRADVTWKAFTANQIVFIDLGPVRADLSVITTPTFVDVTPINIVIRRGGATVSGGSVTVTQPTVTVVPNPLEVEVPVAIRYHPPR